MAAPVDPPPYNMHPEEMIDWVLKAANPTEERLRLFEVIRVLAEKVMFLEMVAEANAEERHRRRQAERRAPQTGGPGLGLEMR